MTRQEEMAELYKQWQELMRLLQNNRKRQDEKNYWKHWEQLQALKKKFLEFNSPGYWD